MILAGYEGRTGAAILDHTDLLKVIVDDFLSSRGFTARVLTVADAFDAMTSPRPYRCALSLDAALDELSRGAGSQFDPAVVRAFVSIPRARLTEVGRYYGAQPKCLAATARPAPPSEPVSTSPPEPRNVSGKVLESPVGAEAGEPDPSGPSERTPVGAAGGAGLDETPSDCASVAEERTDHEPPPPQPSESDQPFLVVARGHRDLLEELRTILGDAIGLIRVIEDRRSDQTILPREDRQGRAHVDWEIEA